VADGSAAFAQQRVKKGSNVPEKPLLLNFRAVGVCQHDVQRGEDIDKRKTVAELASNYFPDDGKALDGLFDPLLNHSLLPVGSLRSEAEKASALGQR
jgi:hypothetical protein